MKSEESSIFVKLYKVEMRLICVHVAVQNIVILKYHNLHNVQLICVFVQRTAQTSFRIFLQTRIMVDGAKFYRHDIDPHFKKSIFKNGHWKKNSYMFATELKLQVRWSMQSLHSFTLLMV